MGSNECSDPSSGIQTHGSLTYEILIFCLLLPFGTWFAHKFWRELNAEPLTSDSPQRQRQSRMTLNVFIVASTAMIWSVAVLWGLALLLNLNYYSFGLKQCAVSSCVVGLLYTCVYACIQRILLQRLQLVFANSTHPVSGRVTLTFTATLALFYALVTGTNIYGWTNSCYVRSHFYEVSGHFHSCRFQESIPRISILFYMAFVMCGNLLLVWMYFWRLKAVFVEANYRQESDERLPVAARDTTSEQRSMIVWRALDVMRKSTVIATWTVASSLFVMATWAFPARTLGPLIDVVLNEVLIYSMVTEDGDDWYNALFSCCHFTVDCCLPQRALNIEHDIEKEFDSKNEETETLKSGVVGVVEEQEFEKSENEILTPAFVEEQTET